ncbi:MAG: SurA N-terminal domain-containing protein [Verrucomicrobiae bacterium]|nr:SurA N-terminal domain-containing protein [Verrucomicrobiae bacterium]
MFQFIRKNQAIGLIFIGIVIVSFVIFFSPNQPGMGGGGVPRGALGSIGGRAIDYDDYMAALKEARLGYWLREGEWPTGSGRGWDEETQVINRLFLLDEARRLGIEVTDEVAAARIVELPFLRDERTGTFNRAAYEQFLGVILQQGGLARTDFERFMRREVALQHLVQLTGMSGALVPPREAEARYLEANRQYSGSVVVFAASNYVAQVDLSPDAIGRHYTNRMAEYRIPERMVVRYVRFAATQFMAEAETEFNTSTNFAQMIDAAIQQRDAETFRDAEGNPQSPEAARTDMTEEFKRNLALSLARRKANEFANRLYQMEPVPDSLDRLAEELGMEAQRSFPFNAFEPAPGMRVPSTFNRAAFALSAEEPFATPVIGEEAVYVYAFDRRIPPDVQPLELVWDRVTESLRRSESRSLAEAAGRAFAAAAQAAVAEGKSFEEASAEAGYAAIPVDRFARSTVSLPQLGLRPTVSELLRVAESLDVGKISGFTSSFDGGFVLFLGSKEPAPEEELRRELPEFLSQARQLGRFSAFMEWERKRFAAADVRFPGRSGAGSETAAAPMTGAQ